MDETTSTAPGAASDLEVTVVHETFIEIAISRVDPADPDAEAYLWVCACGEGDNELARVDAYLEARRHQRLAG